MDRFTLWEKCAVGGWQPAMTYPDLDQARQALSAWAEDFVDEYGASPVRGRDFRLTRDLDPGLAPCRFSRSEARPGIPGITLASPALRPGLSKAAPGS
ncbi:MAG: hypothetical protein ACOY4F_03630 [Thermodesulfobacteriota bacterium]